MEVHKAFPVNGTTDQQLTQALRSLVSSLEDENPTYNAVKDKYGAVQGKRLKNSSLLFGQEMERSLLRD